MSLKKHLNKQYINQWNYIGGIVQDYGISSALEISQSCMKPIWSDNSHLTDIKQWVISLHCEIVSSKYIHSKVNKGKFHIKIFYFDRINAWSNIVCFWKIPSSLQYKMHLSRQLSCWSLGCSWSIACRRCTNYIFIVHLTLGFNILRKDNCKPRWETFKFEHLVHLVLEILWYVPMVWWPGAEFHWGICFSRKALWIGIP